MHLEQRTVGRKTPGDGRLELTKPSALRLRELGMSLKVDINGERTAATVVSMPCTCRGVEKPHEHYFLEDFAFRKLSPGDTVSLELDPEAALVRVIKR